ncbi:MAG: hypothetical protein R2755_02105 [Acidimicrobiales bacterium]
MRDDGEHGQVTVLAAGFVVVLAVLLAGLARVGGRLVQEAVADGAADAAAGRCIGGGGRHARWRRPTARSSSGSSSGRAGHG